MPRRSTLSTFRAFSIDTASAEPLHRQLYSEIRVAILKGRLVSGARLPASRELALVTHVSRNTVLSAYEQLLAEGYIESRPGSGTFVAHTLPESMLPEAAPTLPAAGTHSPRPIAKRGRRLLEAPLLQHRHKGVTHIFRPGLPALDHFPMAIWRRLSDRRFARASMRMLSYDDPQGYLPLREAICRHLAEARGARCVPENIIIVSGSQQAIDLTSRLLLDPDDTVLMEDPGYFGARAAFVASGARVEPVAVDHEGFDIAKARPEAESIARLAYVTPSHQNPLCVTMSLPRRVALLQWAERRGAWILEDDNASEYRYRGRPLAALHGIDSNGRVLNAGTFTKVMYSSLRLGYVVAPPDLVAGLVHARELTDRQSSGVAQAVLADFMTEGHFARHLRRMRTLYAGRLKLLLDAIACHAEGLLEVVEAEGGMNRTAFLPEGVSDCAVAAAAEAEGLMCMPYSNYTIVKPARGGLVLGFAGTSEAEIEPSITRLAAIIRKFM